MDVKPLPKIDLHHHLDGAIRVRTILELARRMNVPLPARTIAGLKPHVSISSPVGSLKAFLRKFEVFYPILRGGAAMERIAYEVCEDQARDNVIYFETRYAPLLSEGPDFTMADSVRAVMRGLERGGKKFGVRWGLILCMLRGHERHSIETVKLAASHGCAGVDLAGDESRPARPHAKAFALARKLRLPITIHAGEARPESNIREAVKLGARRIGHGIRLDRYARELTRRGIQLEMCLTSNLHTGGVPSIFKHPFRRFYEAGVPVTLNTDDPAISNITLSGELDLARRTYWLTREELRDLQLRSASAAFAPAALKRELAVEINSGWRAPEF